MLIPFRMKRSRSISYCCPPLPIMLITFRMKSSRSISYCCPPLLINNNVDPIQDEEEQVYLILLHTLTDNVNDIQDEEQQVLAPVGLHLLDEPLEPLPVCGIARRSAYKRFFIFAVFNSIVQQQKSIKCFIVPYFVYFLFLLKRESQVCCMFNKFKRKQRVVFHDLPVPYRVQFYELQLLPLKGIKIPPTTIRLKRRRERRVYLIDLQSLAFTDG